MPPLDHPDWELFGRLLTGEVSEREEVRHWQRLSHDATYAADWDAARRLWGQLEPRPIAWDLVAGREGVDRRVRQRERAQPPRPITRWRGEDGRRRHAAPIFAALAAAVVIGALVTRVAPSARTVGKAAAPAPITHDSTARRMASRPSPIVADTMRAPSGRTRLVTLADGSRVTLLPGSTLRLLASDGRQWGMAQRHVQLTGEANFAIRRDPLRPFVVTAAHASVEVLGTEFVVSTRMLRHGIPTPGTIGVAVRSGRVQVTHIGRHEGDTTVAHVMRSGDAIAMGESGSITTIRAANLLELHEAPLVFRDARLRDLVAELSQWFGVPLRLAPDVPRTLRVTVTLDAPGLDATLDQLAFVTGLDVTRTATGIVLGPARSITP